MINLSEYQSLIEDQLENISFPKSPKQLYDPLSYFLKIGGKRMRPVLTLMGCELFDPDYHKAKSAAITVELFHNFSLIHDDIMDEAPLRRGQETVHKKWNDNTAILSGDVLLVKAYDYLSDYEPGLFKTLFQLFNKTAIEVCEGQQFDMDFETLDNVSIDSYIRMISYKTAVLLGCSLEMGAIIGGASEKDRQELYEFGLNLGIAFQLQDDIMDVYADKHKFGKQVGGDIISNKKTYLLLKAFEDASESQQNRLNQLLHHTTNTDEKVAGVKAIYEELDIKAKSTAQMNTYYDIAISKLDSISVDASKKAPLYALGQFLLSREN